MKKPTIHEMIVEMVEGIPKLTEERRKYLWNAYEVVRDMCIIAGDYGTTGEHHDKSAG